MTNPTLEQRAREILQRVRGSALWVNDDEAIETAIALATEMLTFSHTGVEQAIEACAKVERDAVVGWLKHQSDLGANHGNEADKGSTKRAAFGGGSLALKRAAEAIEAGEHRTNDNDVPAIRAMLPAQSPDDIAYAGGAHQFEYGNCKDCPGVHSLMCCRNGSTPIAASPVNVEGLVEWPADAQFQLGDAVAKKGRASWRGHVRGWYRTELTAIGYAIESMYEPGSVQIYPESALASLSPDGER